MKYKRRFLSQKDMSMIRREGDIRNARIKRGEIVVENTGRFYHKVWACGCCIDVLDVPRVERPSYY